MSKMFIALLALCLIVSGCQRRGIGSDVKWQTLISKQGSFTIEFPGTSQSSAETLDWSGQKIPVTRYDTPSMPRFSVRSTDYTEGLSAAYDLKALYDYQRDMIFQLTDSRLISERDVWQGTRLGREVVVSQKGGLSVNDKIIVYRLFNAGNRSYQLDVSVYSSTINEPRTNEAIGKFLDSFQITEK